MPNKSIFRTALLLASALASISTFAAARSGKSQAVGSGLAYPTLNHSLFVNSTGLIDAPKGSLQASYLIDPGKAHVSFMSGGSSVGFGAGYRQVGSSSVEEFGFAGRLNVMTLGATLRTQEFEGLDADIAAAFDFGSMRLSVIGRTADAGFDRADVGLGILAGPFTIGLDAKKPLRNGSDAIFFDAGLSAGDNALSAGFGYTFSYDGTEIQGGDIHAGISLGLSQSISAEAFYRPASQEWTPGEWVVGAKIQL